MRSIAVSLLVPLKWKHETTKQKRDKRGTLSSTNGRSLDRFQKVPHLETKELRKGTRNGSNESRSL